MALGAVTPILRIFDEAKAREFYLDYLGFGIVFEHRFGENFPLYMGVERDGCVLHLSEHHGDASPGARIRILTAGIDGFHVELDAKDYRYAKPGLPEVAPWGERSMTINDPFGNKLTFHEPE